MVQSAHMHRQTYNRLFQLSLFSVVVVIIGGVLALLLQPHPVSQADGTSVVGSPSLPEATVNAIFARLGSPMVGTGNVIVQTSRTMHVDDAFALAVWSTETNDGAAGVGRAYRNPGGVRGSPGFPTGSGGYTVYSSFAAGVVDWFGILRSRYVNRGLTTVYSISHPYVGTSSSPLWAGKVTRLMLQYRSEVPIVTVKHSHHPLVPTLNKDKRRLSPIGTVTLPSNQGRKQESSSVQPIPGWVEPSVLAFAFLVVIVLAVWGIRFRAFRKSHTIGVQGSVEAEVVSLPPPLAETLADSPTEVWRVPNFLTLPSLPAAARETRGLGDTLAPFTSKHLVEQLEKVDLVPVDAVGTTKAMLRLAPTKNKQEKNIRWV